MLRDHQASWTFELSASAAECIGAFAATFSKYKPLAHAKWDVKTTSKGAVATYLGRAGLHGIAAGSVGTAGAEEAAAIGSTVSFKADQQPAGTTTCNMRLTKHGTRLLFFTADAKFLRAYMRAVPGELRKLDSNLRIAKS